MEDSGSPAPRASFVHIPGAFESPRLSNTFIDSLQPIAESSAIRPSVSRASVTHTSTKNNDNQSSLLMSGSLNILNLQSLSSKLLPFSMPDEGQDDSFRGSTLTLQEKPKDEDSSSHPDKVCLNNDEVRNLENALSELSSCPRDTGAIATTCRGAEGIISDMQTADTDIDALQSLSTDLDNPHISSFDDVSEQLEGDKSQKSQSPSEGIEWVNDKLSFFAKPLSTIYEWQSRESFTINLQKSTTSYNRNAEEKKAVSAAQNDVNTAAAALMPRKFGLSPNTSPGLRTSGVLQSAQIIDSLQSLDVNSGSTKDVSSSIRGVSKVFDRCDWEESKVLPITLFSPPDSPVKAGRCSVEENQQKRSPTLINQNAAGDKSPKSASQTAPRSSNPLSTTPSVDTNNPLTVDSLETSLTTTVNSASLLQDFTKPINSISTSSGTRAIASEVASPPKDSSTTAVAKNTDSEVNSLTPSGGARTQGGTPDNPRNSPNGDAVNEPVEGVNNALEYPLKATKKCLFWRSVIFEHESKQQFVLRQDSDRIMRLKLEITDGGESFLLLDHRGQYIPKKWRVIDLPPRLACTITVVYKPRPPLLWHTGVLSFCELQRKWNASSSGAVKPRCYVQRLIGYVGSSDLHCDICRAVDERTYWTSAFSAPGDVDESLNIKLRPVYCARVSISNTGLRSAWVFAVAMQPNASHDCSLAPLPGVRVRPERFVLQPGQSQEVVITICDEPREVQVLFYNGDEILRYLCRFKLLAEGRSEPAPPCTLPKPHRRLRSAYILRSIDGEPQAMPLEVPPSIEINAYDWNEALRDEQRSRPPISLTIYPLLTATASTSSFEASSSLIIGSNLEEDVEMQIEELAHLKHESTKCVSGGLSTVCVSGESTNELRGLSYVASRTSCPARITDSVIYDDLQLYNQSSVFSHNSSSVKQEEQSVISPPNISLRPESQLIFAAWNYKKPSCESGAMMWMLQVDFRVYLSMVATFSTPPLFGILELKLSSQDLSKPLDDTSNKSNYTTASPDMSTGMTSSTRRRNRTWRLYWKANPMEADDAISVFSVILPTIPLIVRAGQTHYLPFRFEPPLDTPPGIRFEQRWILTFQFSIDITGTSLFDSITSDKPTQTKEIVFVGTTVKDAPAPERLLAAKSAAALKTPLMFKKTPLVFEAENQERQCEIVNTSGEQVLISLGSCSSPFFEVAKPTVKKFSIDPLCSVRLVVRCRLEDFRHKVPQEEISGALVFWWSLATDRLHKYKSSIAMEARL
ncbi:hypothetical protein Aperf_G00000097754 [Anoplocephala perfoliata]